MEKLKKQLEDIKGALPLMIKLRAIDQSAYKTLNEALDEALQQYAVMGMYYDPSQTNFDKNEDASRCYQALDKAYFSFENGSDFDYFLNGLQNKINVYRKMRSGS